MVINEPSLKLLALSPNKKNVYFQGIIKKADGNQHFSMSEKRDSNPRPQPWQGCALPTELFSHFTLLKERAIALLRMQI